MSDLKEKFNAILKDLEENISNPTDLEYAKLQLYNGAVLFLDEIDKITETNLGRLELVAAKEKEQEEKIKALEARIKNIEREMYISEDSAFTIRCPYCNTDFVEDFINGFKHEVKCPKCGSIVQLDWKNDEECGCDCCDDCEHECGEECDDECCSECDIEEEEIQEDNEDDM